MRVRWMLAVLALVLTAGTVAATAGDDPLWITVVLSLVLFVIAFAFAGVLMAPILAARGLTGRSPWPPWPVTAVALAIGGFLVFPVATVFVDERERSAGGNGCSGILPLPEALQNALTGDDYARMYYKAACAD